MSHRSQLALELQQYEEDADIEFAVDFDYGYNNSLTISFNGPADTPYEDGTFFLEVIIPRNYPASVPKVTMKTPIYHPAFDRNGNFCHEHLKQEWSSTASLRTVVDHILNILRNPHQDCICNIDAHNLYYEDPKAFEDKAREYTIRNAC
jgi:ubiquitin-protein ligase